jgi:hypothetical protein
MSSKKIYTLREEDFNLLQLLETTRAKVQYVSILTKTGNVVVAVYIFEGVIKGLILLNRSQNGAIGNNWKHFWVFAGVTLEQLKEVDENLFLATKSILEKHPEFSLPKTIEA